MATTVNNAFAEFMKEKVNLDQEKTKIARSSRDNLIDNIKGFSGDSDFFVVYTDKILRFGSFERGTKIRPIDDIDLMLCLSGEGTRTYIQSGEVFYINGSDADSKNGLMTDNTNYLNSTSQTNRFKTYMMNLINAENTEGSAYRENIAKLHGSLLNAAITTQEYIGVRQSVSFAEVAVKNANTLKRKDYYQHNYECSRAHGKTKTVITVRATGNIIFNFEKRGMILTF